MKKQVICINWGTQYGARFINRLYGMVSRNITPPFSFTCFTDDANGVRPEVKCQPLPEPDLVIPKTRKGIWPKARLWSKVLADLEGPVLFLDLDTIVVGSLDDFFAFGEADDVILARNPAKLFERLGQTSVYRFPVGKLVPLLTEFRADPSGVATRYGYEQRFVTRRSPGGIRFWPRAWVVHFRRQCHRNFPLNYFYPPRLPSNARVVIFAGGLHPSHASVGGYGGQYPPRPPQAHIKAILRGERRESLFAGLRHYALPCAWVEEAWKE